MHDRHKLTQDFSENENENHADEQSRLLSSTADTCVTNDTDSETSSHAGETDRETSAELYETGVESVGVLCESIGNQDRHDKTVDTNDTSHDDGNNV